MGFRNSPTGYGTGAIFLHWLSTLLILGMIPLGMLASNESDQALRLALLQVHFYLGFSILAVTFLRLLWRMISPPPALPDSMTGYERAAAYLIHLLLLLLLVVMLVTGLMTALFSGAFWVILYDVGELPRSFDNLLTRIIHGAGALVLLILLTIHVAAALYHHFGKKDNVLRRMLRSGE